MAYKKRDQMRGIIIALPKLDDGKKIRRILEQNGFEVYSVCTTGAAVFQSAEHFEEGIVISGYRLSDMYYTQLVESLPDTFRILLIGSAKTVSGSAAGLIALTTPLKVYDLVNTLQMIETSMKKQRQNRKKARKRTEQEENYIKNAKRILMERNHLTEEEAYRYLQKTSMDTGTNMVETAQMVITLIYDEI